MGVEAGWLKQPHLARARLIGLWGWVKLHTCCILSNQCAQVKPATSTHTRGRDVLHGTQMSSSEHHWNGQYLQLLQ